MEMKNEVSDKKEKEHRKTDDIDGLSDMAIRLDGSEFDGGIIGTYEASDGERCLVYGYWKLCRALSEAWGMELGDAAEYVDYNTLRSLPYMGKYRPMIVYETEEL